MTENIPKLILGLRCPVCRVIPTLSGNYFHKEDCSYHQVPPQVEERMTRGKILDMAKAIIT